MHVALIAVAGKPTAWVAEASQRYTRRLPAGWGFSQTLLAPSRKGSDAGQRQQDEWQRIARHLTDQQIVVLLDERGKSLSSRAFSSRIEQWQIAGNDLAFVVGGPDGVNDACKARANTVLSLSAWTMPHEMARVVLIEQLYRAHTIIERHPYHRD